MIVFNTDLDNTLIYSYKHDIGDKKRCVEVYQGREVSFITDETHKLLELVTEKCLIVPTTTRTEEQFDRINLEIGPFKYALICNGGVLLKDGMRDEDWTSESYLRIEKSRQELTRAQDILTAEPRRHFEVRFIEEMFIFTKCSEPENVVRDISSLLDLSLVDVFNNGEKIYVVPKGLDKGSAVRRFREYIGADLVIAAGDSEFDIPMVKSADIGIVPYGFRKKYCDDENLREMPADSIFAEEMLKYIKNRCAASFFNEQLRSNSQALNEQFASLY